MLPGIGSGHPPLSGMVAYLHGTVVSLFLSVDTSRIEVKTGETGRFRAETRDLVAIRGMYRHHFAARGLIQEAEKKSYGLVSVEKIGCVPTPFFGLVQTLAIRVADPLPAALSGRSHAFFD